MSVDDVVVDDAVSVPGAPVCERDGQGKHRGANGRLPSGRGWRAVWGLAAGAGVAVATVGLFVCYLQTSRAQPVDSDAASSALEAWRMLHGNPLLHGWTVTDVSFWATELPEYALVELIHGFGPGVVHVAAAFTYTLVLLLAGWLAKGHATGREAVVRVLIACGIMLAPQLGTGVFVLLEQPDHFGTSVPMLLIFLVLDRWPRRWYTPVAVGVMLTWVVVSDRIALTDAVIPVVLVYGFLAWRGVISRHEPLTVRWFEFAVAGAAILSSGVAAVIAAVLTALGGFTVLPLATQFAGIKGLPGHLSVTAECFSLLFGADVSGMFASVSAGVVALHLAGVAMVVWAACRVLRRFIDTEDAVSRVLAAGICVNLAAFTFSVLSGWWWDSREISPVLAFGAVLAGRLLARDVMRVRWLRLVLPLVLAGYLGGMVYGAVQPAQQPPEQPLAVWLQAHGLRSGLGTYDDSNVTDLVSGGQVTVRAVTWWPGVALPRVYQSEASWYDPRTQYANFVITGNGLKPPAAAPVPLATGIPVPAGPPPSSGVPRIPGASAVSPGMSADADGTSIPARDIMSAFGRPEKTYHFRSYTIMVWNKNLLRDLASRSSERAGNVTTPAAG